ncbi:uncharacterized [Tachysurus ichikawai]
MLSWEETTFELSHTRSKLPIQDEVTQGNTSPFISFHILSIERATDRNKEKPRSLQNTRDTRPGSSLSLV